MRMRVAQLESNLDTTEAKNDELQANITDLEQSLQEDSQDLA